MITSTYRLTFFNKRRFIKRVSDSEFSKKRLSPTKFFLLILVSLFITFTVKLSFLEKWIPQILILATITTEAHSERIKNIYLLLRKIYCLNPPFSREIWY